MADRVTVLQRVTEKDTNVSLRSHLLYLTPYATKTDIQWTVLLVCCFGHH